MPVWQVPLVAAAIAPLSACGAASPSADATPQRGTSASVGPTAAQQLPASASVKIGDKVVQLEVARTPVQLETGLMFRTSMPADRGMVFMVDPPRRLGFWMKDVRSARHSVRSRRHRWSQSPPKRRLVSQTHVRCSHQKVQSIR